ncbi:MAG: hypothetical protein KDD94_05110 [Calditrichaeota bacterium]|nr:hypothetical protein [Calditrichota bacterium]
MRVLICILILFSLANSQDSNDVVIPVDAGRLSQLINNTQELHRFRNENARLDSAYQAQLRAFNQLDSAQLQLRSLISNANKVIEHKTLESEAWKETAQHYKVKYQLMNDIAISAIIGGSVAWATEDPLTGGLSAAGMYLLQLFRITRFSL